MFLARNPLDSATLLLLVVVPGSLLILMWLVLVLRKWRFLSKKNLADASAGGESHMEMGLVGEEGERTQVKCEEGA